MRAQLHDNLACPSGLYQPTRPIDDLVEGAFATRQARKYNVCLFGDRGWRIRCSATGLFELR
jgi:hypothetical protein